MTKEKSLKEGFWRSSHEPDLPFPVPNDTPWEGQKLFVQRLLRVELLAEMVAYKGISHCRVCGCINGSREYSYNGWNWPAGLMHNIVEHNVQPSDEFIEFIEVK
jgi:hypothetical protein